MERYSYLHVYKSLLIALNKICCNIHPFRFFLIMYLVISLMIQNYVIDFKECLSYKI